MARAKGPPCVVCGKPVPLRAVTRCPWCRRVLCLSCDCPNNCARPTPRAPASTGSTLPKYVEEAIVALILETQDGEFWPAHCRTKARTALRAAVTRYAEEAARPSGDAEHIAATWDKGYGPEAQLPHSGSYFCAVCNRQHTWTDGQTWCEVATLRAERDLYKATQATNWDRAIAAEVARDAARRGEECANEVVAEVLLKLGSGADGNPVVLALHTRQRAEKAEDEQAALRARIEALSDKWDRAAAQATRDEAANALAECADDLRDAFAQQAPAAPRSSPSSATEPGGDSRCAKPADSNPDAVAEKEGR